MINHSIRNLLCPECLFSIAYITVLLTHINQGWGTLNIYSYKLSNCGIEKWSLYFAFFIIGCVCGSFFKISKSIKIEDAKKTNKALVISALTIALLYISNIYIYSGFPAISMLLGKTNIIEVETLSNESPPLILGLTTACSQATAFLLTYSYVRFGRDSIISRIYVRMLFLLMIYSLSLICLKRQGAVMITICILTTILLINTKYALQTTAHFFFGKSKRISKLLLLITVAITLVVFGLIGSKRSQLNEHETTMHNIKRYYAIALMNFDYQTQEINTSENVFLLGPLTTLLPYRLIKHLQDIFQYPVKIELTSPSGFWECIQWFWGVPLCCASAFIFGFAIKHIYRKAKYSFIYLGAYSFVPWILISSPLYNHIFNICYFILPVFLIFIFIKLGK